MLRQEHRYRLYEWMYPFLNPLLLRLPCTHWQITAAAALTFWLLSAPARAIGFRAWRYFIEDRNLARLGVPQQVLEGEMFEADT